MNGPGILALVGFFFGIILHVFLFTVVAKRATRGPFERMLYALLAGLLAWYAGNFLSALLRQMNVEKVATALVCTDTVAFLGLALLPPLLVHTHWLFFRRSWRPGPLLSILFPALLVPLYASLALLASGFPLLFHQPAIHPLQKLGSLTTPYLCVLTLAYGLCFCLQVVIARRSTLEVERRVFRALAIQFLIIPVYTVWAFSVGTRVPGPWSQLWVNLALLASLFPALTVAYYIYRHQFLQITVHRSLASAFLVLLVLIGYLAGIRRLGTFLERELEAPTLLLEATFLVALLLFFPPVTAWVQRWVSRSVTSEIKAYRDAGEAIAQTGSTLFSLPDLVAAIERHLRVCFPESDAAIALTPTPSRTAAAGAWELRSGDRFFGYLTLNQPPSAQTAGRHEGMRILAAHVATALERCRLLERQIRLERELAHKTHLEHLGRTAAAIAHNVKNPLSSIKTLLQLQLEAANLTEAQQQEIQMMLQEINRLTQTVTQLLRFSRLDASEPGSAPAPVDVAELLHTLRRLFRGDLESAGLALQIQAGAGPLAVTTNREFLQEIVANLVANAIDASSGKGEIILRANLGEDLDLPPRLILQVADRGEGIAPDALARLAEPFFTTKANGTGLGLAIVSRRVSQLGGTLKIESPGQGHGTTVTVTIPIEGSKG